MCDVLVIVKKKNILYLVALCFCKYNSIKLKHKQMKRFLPRLHMGSMKDGELILHASSFFTLLFGLVQPSIPFTVSPQESTAHFSYLFFFNLTGG